MPSCLGATGALPLPADSRRACSLPCCGLTATTEKQDKSKESLEPPILVCVGMRGSALAAGAGSAAGAEAAGAEAEFAETGMLPKESWNKNGGDSSSKFR
ncbi:unnamed protein product [Caretta caretta]